MIQQPSNNPNSRVMFLLAILFGVVGFALAFYPTRVRVPLQYGPYIGLAALAGMDSLIGGLRAGSEGKFRSNVFISGFLVNAFLAAFLAYLGEQLGQDIKLAAVVALGSRIFVNLSIIRRNFLDNIGGGSVTSR